MTTFRVSYYTEDGRLISTQTVDAVGRDHARELADDRDPAADLAEIVFVAPLPAQVAA
jgi:hypothetical protein